MNLPRIKVILTHVKALDPEGVPLPAAAQAEIDPVSPSAIAPSSTFPSRLILRDKSSSTSTCFNYNCQHSQRALFLEGLLSFS